MSGVFSVSLLGCGGSTSDAPDDAVTESGASNSDGSEQGGAPEDPPSHEGAAAGAGGYLGVGGAGAPGVGGGGGVGDEADNQGGAYSSFEETPPAPVVVPSAAFLVEATADPRGESCDSLSTQGEACVSPWLMAFRTVDDELRGVIVSASDAVRNGHPFTEAAPITLVPESDGVTYRLPPHGIAPLVTYMYGALEVPGVCLVNLERSVSTRDIVSRFRFYDDTGDGVADRVELRGRVVTLGQPSGDFETECGDDGRLFRASGHVLSAPVGLHAQGDALDPRLRVTGGFLTESSAVFTTGAKELAAEPLSLDGFVYGFAAPVTPAPESDVAWRVDGVDSSGRITHAETSAQVGAWPLLEDGGFESISTGSWDAPRSSAQIATTLEGAFDELYPAIAGTHSLLLSEGADHARLRLARPDGANTFRFLALNEVEVTVGVVGGPIVSTGAALVEAPADCKLYPAICAKLAEPGSGGTRPTLFEYSVDLETEGQNVLIDLRNAGDDWPLSTPVWIDELAILK